MTTKDAAAKTPRSPDAEERLLKAARKLFFEHGYESVSTEMLAAEAAMSKSTMYKLFSDKSELFRAMIIRESKRFQRRIEDVPADPEEIRNAIRGFGAALLELLEEPVIWRFEQIMIGQAERHPDIAALFYREAHLSARDNLAEMIAAAQREGLTDNRGDPARLADRLICLWKGDVHDRRQLGVACTGYGDLCAHVEEVMDIILRPNAETPPPENP